MKRTPMEDNSIQNFPSTNKDSSWLEKKLKRTTYKTRYLFVGKPLLWMTCFFGSLGDALFGYDQGTDTVFRRTECKLNDCDI
jgi:hypothetical protein